MLRLFRQAAYDKRVKVFLKWEPYGWPFGKPIIYKEFKGSPSYLSNPEYQKHSGKNALKKPLPGELFASTKATTKKLL